MIVTSVDNIEIGQLVHVNRKAAQCSLMTIDKKTDFLVFAKRNMAYQELVSVDAENFMLQGIMPPSIDFSGVYLDKDSKFQVYK